MYFKEKNIIHTNIPKLMFIIINKNKDTKTQKKMDIRIYVKCFSLVTQRHTKI